MRISMINSRINRKRVIYLFILFLILSIPTFLEAQECVQKWKRVFYESGLPFRDVATNGSRFVVTGDNGIIYTSENGIDWKARKSKTTKNLYVICYSDGLFVAGGYQGALVTSPDGIDWTVRDSNCPKGIWGIAHSGSIWVVGGLDGNTSTSSDGINCTPGTKLAVGIRDIIYADGLFVAACNGGCVYISRDGINWTLKQVASNTFLSAAYGDSTYVLGGKHGELWTSPDTVKWEKVNHSFENYFWGIVYTGSHFIIACNKNENDTPDNYQNNAPVVISADKTNWTKIHTGSDSHLRGIATNGTIVIAMGDRRISRKCS